MPQAAIILIKILSKKMSFRTRAI